MLRYPTLFLDLSISLVTNNKLNYSSLVTLVLVLLIALVVGAHLGMTGIDWVQHPGALRKVGGGLLLLGAGLCVLAVLGLGYWEVTQLVDLL